MHNSTPAPSTQSSLGSNPFDEGSRFPSQSPSIRSLPPLSGSSSALNIGTPGARRFQRPFRSRKIPESELGKHEMWQDTTEGKASLRRSYWTFIVFLLPGIAGAVVLLVTTYFAVAKHEYCLVLDEQFTGSTLDTSIWQYEHQVGGFGNNEFEWTTDSANNSFIADGKLYIVPTLTSDAIGIAAITNGYVLNLTSAGTCTGRNTSDCAISSNDTLTNISTIPPIQSARISTKLSKSIRFGRVEVSAKMPTGDWIWPAIWMMPRDSVYGEWPASGEIDIVESKGNVPQKQSDSGTNEIRSSLHFGPTYYLDRYDLTTGVLKLVRNWYNSRFRTFGLEWDDKSIWTWKDSRARTVMSHEFKQPFWQLGGFTDQSSHGTAISSPWTSSNNTNVAPFDQEFYLILNVAVGGTNGYFADDAAKPWSNTGLNPALDFWNARYKWLHSWPTDPKERGMAIEYVKMWSIKEKGVPCPSV